MVKKLEQRIIGKMSAIERGDISIDDSNKEQIALLFNKIKTLDEALYINLVSKYKDIIIQL